MSPEARQSLVERDLAHQSAIQDPTPENYRAYKNLRNLTNRIITKDRYTRKKEKFQTENSSKQKWNLAKQETGQQNFTFPEQIREGNKIYTKPREMAASMNRQYLSSIREAINKIPRTTTNPLKLYQDSLGPIDSKLNFHQLTMNDLKKVLSTLSATTSTAKDFISMKLLKDAGESINTHLLFLVNKIIETEEYPKELKLTKIVPIKKPEEDPKNAASWRPINIVPSLSKIVEKSLLLQITKYLNENKIIHHTHHGSVGGKNTQTLIQELYDNLLTALENGDEMTLIQLDQSKAYDVIDHQILLQKLKYLGFNRKAIRILRSYLSERRQFVVIDSFPSETLAVGPRSVTQGSTLSCVLYIVYILDITRIFHDVQHTPKEYNLCHRTNAKTFVDDNFLLTKPRQDQTLHDSVAETMDKVTDYMNANLLIINPDKSKIMVISNNQKTKANFEFQIGQKTLKHQNSLKILGNIVTEDLSWDRHVQKIVIPELANRARTLKLTASFMDPKFRKVYATALFKGKLNFAIEAWGGVAKTLVNKVQLIQDRVTKSALGSTFSRKSSYQRQKEMNWLSVVEEIKLSTIRMTHKIAHRAIPEELASKMPLNVRNLRLTEAHKLDTKPRFLNKNTRTRASFRNRAYVFNTLPNRLTAISDPKRFNRWLKVFLRDPTKLPITIPTVDDPKPKPNQTKNRRRGGRARERPPKNGDKQPNPTLAINEIGRPGEI